METLMSVGGVEEFSQGTFGGTCGHFHPCNTCFFKLPDDISTGADLPGCPRAQHAPARGDFHID